MSCCGVDDFSVLELPTVVQEDSSLIQKAGYMERAWEWIKPRKCFVCCQAIRAVFLITAVFSTIAAGTLLSSNTGSQGFSEKDVVVIGICAGSIMGTSIAFSMRGCGDD